MYVKCKDMVRRQSQGGKYVKQLAKLRKASCVQSWSLDMDIMQGLSFAVLSVIQLIGCE